jgi:hypothetical protein
MGLQIFNETYPVNITRAIVAASGIAPLDSNNSGVGACRIDQVWAANNDVIDHVVGLHYYQGGSNFRIGGVNVPAGAGFGATTGIELISAIMGLLNTGIVLQSADSLGVNVDVVMTGTSRITLVMFGGQL